MHTHILRYLPHFPVSLAVFPIACNSAQSRLQERAATQRKHREQLESARRTKEERDRVEATLARERLLQKEAMERCGAASDAPRNLIMFCEWHLYLARHASLQAPHLHPRPGKLRRCGHCDGRRKWKLERSDGKSKAEAADHRAGLQNAESRQCHPWLTYGGSLIFVLRPFFRCLICPRVHARYSDHISVLHCCYMLAVSYRYAPEFCVRCSAAL